MSDREKIKARLAKLSRLAQSPNEHEAKLAKTMYERLAKASGLTADEPAGHPSGMQEIRMTFPVFGLQHKLSALLTMEEFPVTPVIMQKIANRPRILIFTGPPEVLESSRELMAQLLDEFGRGLVWYAARRIFCQRGLRKGKADFCNGLFHALNLRMRKARAARAEASKPATLAGLLMGMAAGYAMREAEPEFALAKPDSLDVRERIDTYNRDAFPDIKERKVKVEVQYDSDSFRAGCRFGLSILFRGMKPEASFAE